MGNLIYLCKWSCVNANVSVSSIFKYGQFYFKYYSVTNISLFQEIQQSVICHVSIWVYQNTKSTADLYIYNIFGERTKAFLKMFIIDVEWVTFSKRPGDVTSFVSIFCKILLYVFFFNIWKYISKHIDRNIKNNFFIWINFLRDAPKDMWRTP